MKSAIQTFVYIQCMSIIGINAKPLISDYPHVQSADGPEFSFAGSLGYTLLNDPTWHHFCGATLITNIHIITTKSCFKKAADLYHRSRKIGVKFGSSEETQNSPFTVQEPRITYNLWLGSQHAKTYVKDRNDVAVLWLQKAVPSTITPAIISEHTLNDLSKEYKVTHLGWGRNSLEIIDPSVHSGKGKSAQSGQSSLLSACKKPLRKFLSCTKLQKDHTYEEYQDSDISIAPRHLSKAELRVIGTEKAKDGNIATRSEHGVHIEKYDHGAPVLDHDGKLIGINADYIPSQPSGAEASFLHVHRFRNFISHFQAVTRGIARRGLISGPSTPR